MLVVGFLIFACHFLYEMETHSIYSINQKTFRFPSRTARSVLNMTDFHHPDTNHILSVKFV